MWQRVRRSCCRAVRYTARSNAKPKQISVIASPDRDETIPVWEWTLRGFVGLRPPRKDGGGYQCKFRSLEIHD